MELTETNIPPCYLSRLCKEGMLVKVAYGCYSAALHEQREDNCQTGESGMGKFVLMVHLEVKVDSIDAFLEAALLQAETSLQVEPGCHRFDIAQDVGNPSRITHYEVFEDEAAFEAHAASAHTAAFGATIEPMLIDTQLHRAYMLQSRAK